MRIQVIFCDGNVGLVDSEKLENLIQTRRIMAFRRSDAWVRVGRDQVRGESKPFRGQEKRNNNKPD